MQKVQNAIQQIGLSVM